MRLRSTAIGLVAVLLLGASAPAVALETVTIKSCYDSDNCRRTAGERIRLVCIDTPEMRGRSIGAMVNIELPSPTAITFAEWWSEKPSPFAASRRTDSAEPSGNYPSTG